MDDMKLPVYNCDFSVVTRQHLGWAWTKLHQICSRDHYSHLQTFLACGFVENAV